MMKYVIATLAVVAGTILIGPPPASAIGPCEAQKQLPARHLRHLPDRRPAFAVGDSVMLGAAEALAHAGIRVNARGCRQISAGLAILARHHARHRLPRVVIVALGSNWVITPADIHRALQILSRRQLLVLVTPHEPGGSDAALMRRAARRHAHRICLADWASYSSGRPDWAPGDGLHLAPAGIVAFTRLLKPYRRVRPPEPGRRTRCPRPTGPRT